MKPTTGSTLPSITNHAWFSPLLPILLICYGIFFAGYFFIPKEFEGLHYKFFYTVIILLSLPLLPLGFRSVSRDPLFLLLFSYLAYMLSSITWSDPLFDSSVPWRNIYQYLKQGLQLLIFIIGTRVLVQNLPTAYERMRLILFFMAGLGAALSMLLWYSENPFPDSRLQGMSLMQNPNDMAFVYGAICTWGFSYIVSSKGLLLRLAYLPVLMLLVAAILFSQSRGTLLALACAMGIFGLLGVDRKGIALILLLLGLALLSISITQPVIIEQMLTRGDMFRGALWLNTLREALDHYFVGAGYLSNAYMEVGGEIYNAHNAYLATFRDGGLVGLALLTLALFLACRRAYLSGQQSGDYTWLVALVFGMACMITSGDRLIDRPKEPWIFFWFPIAMIIAPGPVKRPAKTD